MRRKSSLAAPKSASKKQAKKQLRLQPAQFGELETTPTSHHEKSPIPSVGQKTRASHTDCHDTDQIVDPEEFEDGVDDNDMAKLADTPKKIKTPRDREIIWSEKDSETHRSSSMSPEEEEQSGHVFGYIRDDIPFTSPASGHDALPDTLPLSAPPVSPPSADCQSQSSQHVDFSETASTLFRSSPFGRSHASRGSVTTSQPASTKKDTTLNLVGMQLPALDPSDKGIPHASADSQTNKSDKNPARVSSARQITEETLPSSCHPISTCGVNLEAESVHTVRTLGSGDILLDHITLDLPDANGERRPKAPTIPCDAKPPKKRKQRPKTPIQFDENTQEVKSVSRQPLYRRLYNQPVLRDEQEAFRQEKIGGKKRKSDVSNSNNLQKKVKPAVIDYAESLVVDSDTNRQCVSRPSCPDPQHSLKDLHNDEISHDIIKEQAQKSQVMSPTPFKNNDVGDFQTTDTETILPQSNRTRSQLAAVKTIKPTEKVGDCIFVATSQKRTGHDITTAKETWKDFFVLNPRMKSRPSAGVEGDGDAGVSTDDSKKTNSAARTTGVARSSSKHVNFQTSQAQHFSKSKMVQKTATDRRIGQNFSVSERGSPIPRQQQESRVDIPCTKESSVSLLDENIPGIVHGHFEVQNCTLIPKKHRSQVQRAEEWAPVKANFESIQNHDLIQHGDHPELLQSIVSDIRRILTKHPNINKTEHAAQPVTTSDRSRQQLHELVDVRFSDHIFVKDSSND
ncbi:uncharacterized protein G6M90_00g019500 [Metarhizium brunneum]|uniref:Uncharacterized protein n=1 Tax=Metarhizium brunneum TaxID=500148 RepID=A0A7D5UQK3_9HYPO